MDNIIHSRSGIELRLYCAKMMQKQGHEEPTGQAKITPAFNLPSRYILHTVGPIIYGDVQKRMKSFLLPAIVPAFRLRQRMGLAVLLLLYFNRRVPLFK